MRRPSTAAASSSGGAGSHSARSSTLEALDHAALDVRREVAPDRLYLGQLGHTTQGYEGLPRQFVRLAPREPKRRAEAPTAASGRIDAPPVLTRERSQQGRVLPRVVGAGVRGIAAVVGTQHEQVSVAHARKQRATEASISRERRRKALHVLAVPIHLVGVDEIGEHEPAAPSASRRSIAAVAVGLSCAWCSYATPRPANTGRPCRSRARRHRRPRARQGSCAWAAQGEVVPAGGAAEVAGAPSNGRAITRPPRPVLTREDRRARGSTRQLILPRRRCAAIWKTESCDV